MVAWIALVVSVGSLTVSVFAFRHSRRSTIRTELLTLWETWRTEVAPTIAAVGGAIADQQIVPISKLRAHAELLDKDLGEALQQVYEGVGEIMALHQTGVRMGQQPRHDRWKELWNTMLQVDERFRELLKKV